MSPPPDKIRPWITVRCAEEDCDFETQAEFAARAHEQDTGHRIDYEPWTGPAGGVIPAAVSRDSLGWRP